MTREIALHCMKSYSELHSDLCELCPIYGQTGSDHCFEDALQYVIGMLEQEPTKNDLGIDCISRADALSDNGFRLGEYHFYEGYTKMQNHLKSLPSVTPQLSSELEKNSQKLEKNFGELDCISRADINQVIEDYMDEQYHVLSDRTRERAFGAKTVMARINELPTVTSQPRKGHWISHREHCENLGVIPSGLGAYEWCSECDCGIDVMEWHRNNYNYCPNCGCRMVESQESEDKG